MNYIIPVHNEAQSLPVLLRDIFSYDGNANICILNSASTDDTISIVQKYPIQIVDTPQGYTQALAVGYCYARYRGWDSVIQLDGDGQHHPMYAFHLHKQLSCADWVVASRHKTGSIGSRGIRYASWIGTRYLLGSQLHDPSSGYWALNAKAIDRFSRIFPVSFTEIPLRVAESSFLRIVEVSVPMEERKHGLSMNAGWKGVIHGLKMLSSGWKEKKRKKDHLFFANAIR